MSSARETSCLVATDSSSMLVGGEDGTASESHKVVSSMGAVSVSECSHIVFVEAEVWMIV